MWWETSESDFFFNYPTFIDIFDLCACTVCLCCDEVSTKGWHLIFTRCQLSPVTNWSFRVLHRWKSWHVQAVMYKCKFVVNLHTQFCKQNVNSVGLYSIFLNEAILKSELKAFLLLWQKLTWQNVNIFWHIIWTTFCHLNMASSIKTDLLTCKLWTDWSLNWSQLNFPSPNGIKFSTSNVKKNSFAVSTFVIVEEIASEIAIRQLLC